MLDESRSGTQKENGDLRASLREVERSRLEARRELQELRRQVKFYLISIQFDYSNICPVVFVKFLLSTQVKMLDGENNKKSKELEDLQARVARDEEKEDEARKESFGLKQKIVATEASKEQALKEVIFFNLVCDDEDIILLLKLFLTAPI